jgi:hypothetical protein
MILRELKQSDIDYLKNHSISRTIFNKIPEETDIRVAIEENGITLAIGGIQMINSTTAWCWVDLSDEAGKHVIIVYRLIKTWLGEMVEKMGIKRLQCYVEQDFAEGHNMVKHLGFEFEHTMLNFVGNKPADLYRRLS